MPSELALSEQRRGRRLASMSGLLPLEKEVHLWRVGLQVDGWRLYLQSDGLMPSEVARARRLRSLTAQQSFVVSRVATRTILAGYLGVEPRALHLAPGPYGKPFVSAPLHEPRLEFSVSRSHDLAVVAVTRQDAVGIDIERIRPIADVQDVANRMLSKAEAVALEAVPAAAKELAFLRCWTRKESYLKACGTGIGERLANFDVTVWPDDTAALLTVRDRPGDETRWALVNFDAAPGFVGTLAVANGNWRLAHREWTPPDAPGEVVLWTAKTGIRAPAMLGQAVE